MATVALPTVPLPSDPDLDQLRTQARELQRRVRDGDEAALVEVGLRHPAGAPPDDERSEFALHAAQLVLARRHGFDSWPKLVAHLEVVDQHGRRPGDVPSSDDPAHELVRLGCVVYDDADHEDNHRAARAIAAGQPELASTDLAAAVVLADVEQVRAHLARDRGAASRPTGPMAWEPLLYLAFSRVLDRADEPDVVSIATLLFDHGADPSAGYLWRGLVPPFTALTGCFGEGELGPDRQPRHAAGHALARLLLERGADANDGQALYNRQFHESNDHLELLFEFGLGRGDGGPWKRRLGSALESPSEMVRGQLRWALLHGMTERVRLLAGHGVALDGPLADDRTPAEIAAMNGDVAMVELLAELGAPPPNLDPDDAVIAALMAGDDVALARATARDPDLLGRVRAARPGLVVWAAASGRTVAVERVLDHGFAIDALARSDVPAEQPWETALHVAAMRGDLDLIRILLDRGADPTIRDARFEGRPLEWARHFDHATSAELLDSVTPAAAEPD